MAQQTNINSGGPAIPPTGGVPIPPSLTAPSYLADQFFSGGAPYTDPAMGTGVFTTLRFAPSFSYDIPEQNGFYYVLFRFVEPNKTAAGQRLFTVTANGITSDIIDVFLQAGGVDKPYSMWLLVMVGNGHMRISFTGVSGNAIVSAIEITPVWITLPGYTPSPGTVPQVLNWQACPTAQCAGVEYLQLVKADGTQANRIAVPVPSYGFNPDASWLAVK